MDRRRETVLLTRIPAHRCHQFSMVVRRNANRGRNACVPKEPLWQRQSVRPLPEQTPRFQRTKGDTPHSVCQKLKAISALAFPGEENSDIVTKLNIVKFASLWPELGLKKEFRRKRPTTLDEAVRVATAMEDDEAAETLGPGRASKDTDFDADGNRKKDRAQARTAEVQVVACAVQASESALQKEIDELKAKMTAITEKLNTPRPSTGYKGKKPYQGHDKARKPFLCYGCNEEGHMKRNCPKSAEGKETNAKDPPTPPAAARRAAGSLTSPDTYMDIEMNGLTYQCLIDSGCDQSLIPLDYVRGAQLTPVAIDVKTATGGDIRVLGSTTVHFRVGDTPLWATVLVT